jgi:hypothetical protein
MALPIIQENEANAKREKCFCIATNGIMVGVEAAHTKTRTYHL